MSLTLLALALAAGLATLAGGFLVLRYRRSHHYFFAFSAGSLIAVVFLDLLPESLALGAAQRISSRNLFGTALVAFFLYSLIDRYFLTHHLHDDDEHGHPIGLVGAGSLVLHSFLDGAAIGTAFQASPTMGMVLASAVIAHDMTDGLNTVVLMQKQRQPRRRVLLFLLLGALAPLLGIIAASWLVLPGAILAYGLAFFSGEFLYLGAGSLLPETRTEGSPQITLALALGAGLVAFLSWLGST